MTTKPEHFQQQETLCRKLDEVERKIQSLRSDEMCIMKTYMVIMGILIVFGIVLAFAGTIRAALSACGLV